MNESQIYHMKTTANKVLYYILAMQQRMDSLTQTDVEAFKSVSMQSIVNEFQDLENSMQQIRDIVNGIELTLKEKATE